MSAKRPKELSRAAALAARPEPLPAVRRDDLPDGGLNVTVRFKPARLARWFRGSGEVERTFGLDYLGREVYEACDGKTDVKAIVRRFASAHKLSLAEAELSVSTFLKMLMAKGLVAMAMDRGGEPDRRG